MPRFFPFFAVTTFCWTSFASSAFVRAQCPSKDREGGHYFLALEKKKNGLFFCQSFSKNFNYSVIQEKAHYSVWQNLIISVKLNLWTSLGVQSVELTLFGKLVFGECNIFRWIPVIYLGWTMPKPCQCFKTETNIVSADDKINVNNTYLGQGQVTNKANVKHTIVPTIYTHVLILYL